MKTKILIAEDDLFHRTVLTVTLREWGFEPVETADGASAWDILQQDDAPKIAIVDWMMPKMDGLELCRRVRAQTKPEPTYLIMLTSKEGKESIVNALNDGADDFIHKPFNREELLARVRVGERIVGLQTSQALVFALARAVEAKSSYTQGHADRVAYYSLALAGAVGIPAHDLETLRRGAILHDVGKMSIPDALLNKPGRLSDEEMNVIKAHPVLGENIVRPLQSLKGVLPLIRWHHERMDGAGYPDRLPGERIPQLVRILSVADVYDALQSARPYRPAIPHQQCLKMLLDNASGGGLDLELARQFARLPDAIFGDVAAGRDCKGLRISSLLELQDCA